MEFMQFKDHFHTIQSKIQFTLPEVRFKRDESGIQRLQLRRSSIRREGGGRQGENRGRCSILDTTGPHINTSGHDPSGHMLDIIFYN